MPQIPLNIGMLRTTSWCSAVRPCASSSQLTILLVSAAVYALGLCGVVVAGLDGTVLYLHHQHTIIMVHES